MILLTIVFSMIACGTLALRLVVPPVRDEKSSSMVGFLDDCMELAQALNVPLPSETLSLANEVMTGQNTQNNCWKSTVQELLNLTRPTAIADKKPSIMIVSLMYGYPKTITDVVLKNHQRYATKHGYAYRSVVAVDAKELNQYFRGRQGGWAKLSLVQEIFSKPHAPDYVFWMDADSLFVDNSIQLEDLVKLSKDFVVAGDQNGINTGHFLLQNSAWSRELFDSSWSICPPPLFQYEQAGIMAILGGADRKDNSTWRNCASKCCSKLQTMEDSEFMMRNLPSSTQEHIMLLPQCTLNVNDADSLSKDTFIWHMAGGASLDRKAKKVVEVEGRIEQLAALLQAAWAKFYIEQTNWMERKQKLPC